MSVLYITGSKSGAGKTAFATGLAKILADSGHSVAIIKPIKLPPPENQSANDADTQFFLKHFNHEASNQIYPLIVNQESIKNKSLPKEIAKAIAPIDRNNEFVLVEGLDGITLNDPISELSAEIAAELNAQIIIMTQYESSLVELDVKDATQLFGSSLLGIIVNRVWRNRNHWVTYDLIPTIERQSIRVIGVIPEDRRMLAPSVNNIATHLSGKLLTSRPEIERPVDYIMTGGWYLDQGAYVLSRRNNKAVVVRGDRPDLQMAALTTSTSCLILTEGKNPIQYITYHAEQEQIPILITEDSTLATMEQLNTLDNQVTIHNDWKATRFAELIKDCCSLNLILP
ncbi:phosphotransacetylase family protein [SAR202 cluster bacterium AD-802-E10_MRT_200m]|nr:phosphotransacetylase family protein [SAR202 cluster bacterium AD-802-E10_MRT_200m]